MPVRKYRHVGEMDRDIWYRRGDPQLFRAMKAVWNLWQTLAKPTFPPGVYRFRSVEDASEQRKVWERRTIERLQRARHPG
jgi:hypothetical protein